jgi:hypothetical protein
VTERWRPVIGYEGLYQVSDQGRVWSEPRWSGGKRQGERYREGRILQPLFASHGYPKYGLSRDGEMRQHMAHTLVLTAFVGPAPPGMECCHDDGDPANCALPNLRWDTHGNNLRDKVKHGTDHHASRTHCPNRHEYRPDNLTNGAPHRQCLACSKAHNRLCRGGSIDHSSAEFRAAADWYYANPGRRWARGQL